MCLFNKTKLVIGLLFLLISLLGCFPFLNDAIKNKVTSRETTKETLTFREPYTEYDKPIIETNYPILVGCFALTGALLICSIKNNK